MSDMHLVSNVPNRTQPEYLIWSTDGSGVYVLNNQEAFFILSESPYTITPATMVPETANPTDGGTREMRRHRMRPRRRPLTETNTMHRARVGHGMGRRHQNARKHGRAVDAIAPELGRLPRQQAHPLRHPKLHHL